MKVPVSKILDQDWLLENGIVTFGVSRDPVPQTLSYYENWVANNLHGPLGYLADHRADLRKDIRKVFPQFQSALVFLFSYQETMKNLTDFYQSEASNGYKIASYVMGFEGEDYHLKILETLNKIKDKIQAAHPEFEVAHSLDIQPILERDLAYRAGLGWFGKNSMLINRDYGSYFLIGSLLLSEDVDLPSQTMEVDHCGNCTACIEACPTQAILEDERTLVADKCISTFTIELFKDSDAPEGMVNNANGEIFGCDICQIVCPWNKKSEKKITTVSEEMSEQQKLIYEFFLTRDLDTIIQDLENMSNKGFKRMFKGTSMERTGRIGLLKNINAYNMTRNHHSK